MTDDPTSDPSPVAEYRDPELARRFDAAPVPPHGPDFWDDLESALSGAGASADASGELAEVTALMPVPALPVTLETPSADAETAPVVPDPIHAGRWGAGRWLAVAAALLAVVGAGTLAVALANGTSSPIVSAAPASNDASSTTVDLAADDTLAPSTTVPAPSTSTTEATVMSPPPSADDTVDHFGGDTTVVTVGTGRAVGFSPDDSALLVVDDQAGPGLGCEGAHLLALHAQDLATGIRIPALPEGIPVETGGLELAISPFGATPAEVGTRPVYWTDWCDGVRATTRRGVLAPTGTISMIEDVEAGSEDDPFASGSAYRGASADRLSPDGASVVLIDDRLVQVAPADDLSAGVPLPEVVPTGETVYRTAVWSPGGDVVAVATDSQVVLWNPVAGDQRRFDAVGVVDLIFDNSGRRLAVVSTTDTGFATNILTFGGLPDPVPAPARCSGATELGPLDARSLTTSGIPTEVAVTAAAIDRAASTCDWAVLGRLAGKDFTASFGGSDPVDLWQAQEADGRSPMWTLRQLLRLPVATRAGEDGAPAQYVWPSLQLREDCDYRRERKTLDALGYDLDQAEEDCEQIGGYLGYRTAIDATGRWRYFVAGD